MIPLRGRRFAAPAISSPGSLRRHHWTRPFPSASALPAWRRASRRPARRTCALIVSDRPCSAAAPFTRNAFPAAPVLYDRGLVTSNPAGLRGVAINSGCANACTGDAGLADAALMARLAEAALGLPPRSPRSCRPASSARGCRMDRIRSGAELAAQALGSLTATDAAAAAARAIMTTDTRPEDRLPRGRASRGCSAWPRARG